MKRYNRRTKLRNWAVRSRSKIGGSLLGAVGMTVGKALISKGVSMGVKKIAEAIKKRKEKRHKAAKQLISLTKKRNDMLRSRQTGKGKNKSRIKQPRVVSCQMQGTGLRGGALRAVGGSLRAVGGGLRPVGYSRR
jgi:hypothetical protein